MNIVTIETDFSLLYKNSADVYLQGRLVKTFQEKLSFLYGLFCSMLLFVLNEKQANDLVQAYESVIETINS